ncbi:GreA/GreB family elongation factor [Polaribacter sargassicola]|uniref:GreA/GreB family elongation factor n=1 Tax=Polaribacter sargassicola TaxID=2836891 RepID=UPI001F3B217C|nr:GreA/GreB family elongation factor [Polaribacter sp. DS7-9]MCG1035132.1 GreA/GreB family elongation factor [Polaribacter sp. DS7-9]
MEVKKALFEQCLQFVNNRLQTVEEIISSNQKALQSETKSSAGDKHETGRAMLQLEMEKASQQLAGINQMKEILSKINISKKATIAHLGSVIETDVANYFLAISAGQIKLDNKVYFVVSVSSPIGKLLLGKKVNDKINFNGKTFNIKEIS